MTLPFSGASIAGHIKTDTLELSKALTSLVRNIYTYFKTILIEIYDMSNRLKANC